MSLKKSNIIFSILAVIILVLSSFAFLFPSVTDSIITGFASVGQFTVAVFIIHARFNVTNRTQINPVFVNGSNISIQMPVHYYDNITMNLSLDKPTDFECGFGWYVNESGIIKNITVNGNTLSWIADKSVKDTNLFFQVAPPSVSSEIIYTGDSFYEKTLIISSCCPLSDVTANISVNSAYEFYTLYLIENNTFVNKSSEYNLQVSNGRALFSGFNLSNKTFRLTANPNATQVTVVNVGTSGGSGGGGGGGGGGAIPLLNYSQQKKFIVEPNFINIITSNPDAYDATIIIYNLRGGDKTFDISFTNNFVYDIISQITVPAKEFKDVLIHMDATGLEPGIHTDYVSVSDEDGNEEKITIKLEVLETTELSETGSGQQGEGSEGGIPPEEEQPLSFGRKKEQITRGEKPNWTALILSVLGGLIVMGGVVFLHLRSKTKLIKY